MAYKHSKEFVNELLSKGQFIKHSGVVDHHHNAVSENSIKTTVRTDFTMIIHLELRWPEHNERDIWSQTLKPSGPHPRILLAQWDPTYAVLVVSY